MLGLIDEFEFEMTKTEFDSISHIIEFGWVSSSRIANHPKHQATSKSSEKFTFKGTLILQSINSFNELIKIAEKQEPVVLSFVNANTIMVVIKSISKDMSIFLNTGEYIKQGFSIELERWYK
ncbi:MAG: hypothetical protein C0625_02160 [Arcobacter sp.]|nr:MAG: hypothetical protein C0625_02160 [Arcobacter sp.]